MVLFSAWRSRRDGPVGSNLESFEGQRFFSMKSEQFACSLPVLRDACHVSWGTVLMEDEALTAFMTANGSHFEHLQ